MPRAYKIEVDVISWSEDDVEVRIASSNEFKVDITIVYEYEDPYHAYGVIPADYEILKAVWHLDVEKVWSLLEERYNNVDIEFGYNTIEFTAPRA